MQYRQRKKAILLLEDGTVFHGFSAGKIGYATGELCFNTGMTGYQEVFTDPSYFGQLMITTNAHIGNYGIKKTEVESSEIRIAGLICKNLNPNFSRAAFYPDANSNFSRRWSSHPFPLLCMQKFSFELKSCNLV